MAVDKSMDFYANLWAPERRPFQPEFQYRAAPAPAPALRRSPKVVQIPVQYPGDVETRSASALKIQKVFRGYLVRKSVRKIIGIKHEVDAIEARVSEKEVMDLIRQKDGKERLKVNEALMALLFKLDAVSGCGDSGIRICRKAVIGKAIALQENVDSIANDQALENDNEELEAEYPHEKSTGSDQIHGESVSNSMDSSMDEGEEYEFVEQNLGDELKGDRCSLMEEDEKEIGVVPDKAADCCVEGRELAEIVQQNGKLMKMMVELLESNEAQAKMITSLSHRLEQLEETVMLDKIDKIRRRKKSFPLES